MVSLIGSSVKVKHVGEKYLIRRCNHTEAKNWLKKAFPHIGTTSSALGSCSEPVSAV
jgi:hypothetical protein